MSRIQTFTAPTIPFTNGPPEESLPRSYIPPCVFYPTFPPVHRGLGDQAYFLDSHSAQHNFNAILHTQLSTNLPVDPNLAMNNPPYSQSPLLRTPVSTGSSPVSRRTQPFVGTSAPGVCGSGSFSLIGILPAQPQNESNNQQDILPISRCSSISSGQPLSEQAANRGKASSFRRKGRSGNKYVVCPKQAYHCLWRGCSVKMQKACEIREHYFSVHALFNAIQCDQCGNSYARPCTHKRHLKPDGTCPKARPEGLTPVQKEQGMYRKQLKDFFEDMTVNVRVKEGVRIIRYCNTREDMRKRKRRPGGNIRSSGMESILSTQDLQESESGDSSDYDGIDMDSSPEARALELEGNHFARFGMDNQLASLSPNLYMQPFDIGAIELPYGSSGSSTASQNSRSITPRNNQLPCLNHLPLIPESFGWPSQIGYQ